MGGQRHQEAIDEGRQLSWSDPDVDPRRAGAGLKGTRNDGDGDSHLSKLLQVCHTRSYPARHVNILLLKILKYRICYRHLREICSLANTRRHLNLH